MPIPSKSFVNSLKGLDPLLSVKWSDDAGQWVILRKGSLTENELNLLKKRRARLSRLIDQGASLHPNKLAQLKSTYIGVHEDIKAGEDGKRVILFARNLSPKVYDALVLADMRHYGGYARFADQLEAKEAKQEAELEQKLAEQRVNFNKEVYDMLNHIWRKKEDKLLNGERDLNYLLHGKRREKDQPAVVQITDF